MSEEVNEIRGLLQHSSLLAVRLINAQRGAIRLPPEILHMIFLRAIRLTDISHYVHVTDHEVTVTNRTYIQRSREVGWRHNHLLASDVLTLSHVCYRWREVTLAFHTLWNSVSDFNPGAAPTFFAHAANRRLSVLLANGSTAWPTDVCAKQGPNMQQLLWISSKHEVNADVDVPSVLNFKAPRLERLLLARGHEDQATDNMKTILSGETDNVRLLSIMHLNWLPLNHFPSLTHLIITDHITLTPLLAFLARCPNLQTLVLSVHQTLDLASAPQLAIAHLPHLHRLSAYAAQWPNPPLLQLFENLDFDRSRAAIQLTCGELLVDAVGRRGSILDGPPPALSRITHNGPRARYTHLCIRSTGCPEHTFSVFATSETGGVCMRGFTSELDFRLTSIIDVNIPLDHVSEVWLDGPLTLNIVEVIMIWLRRLTSLRTVVVVRPDRPRGPRPVAPPSDDPDDDNPSSGPQNPRTRGRAGILSYMRRGFDDDPALNFEQLVAVLRLPPEALTTFDNLPARRTSFTLRLILSDGRDPLEDRMKYDLFRTVCGGVLAQMRTRRNDIVVEAPAFSPSYYDRVVPALKQNWVTVETVVKETPSTVPMPECCREIEELSAWEAW